MATVNIQFTPQAGYAGTYKIIAYTSANPTVAVNQVDVTPPFTNPVSASLSVPTLEEHIVKVFALVCNKLVGQVTVFPPPPQQRVSFKNNMTVDVYQITQVNVDGINILSSPILGSGGIYNHLSNNIIATNPHSVSFVFSGVAVNINIQAVLKRNNVIIYTQSGLYNGNSFVFSPSVSFQNNDIVEVVNI